VCIRARVDDQSHCFGGARAFSLYFAVQAGNNRHLARVSLSRPIGNADGGARPECARISAISNVQSGGALRCPIRARIPRQAYGILRGVEDRFPNSIYEDRYTFRSISGRSSDGRVVDSNVKTIGTGHACFGQTGDPKLLNFYAEIMGTNAFSGIGSCRSIRPDFPELGLAANNCFLDISKIPQCRKRDLRWVWYGEADGRRYPTGVVPWTSFSRRDHHSMRTLVPPVSAQLPRSRGDDGRAWVEDRSFDHRPLGAQIRSGPEPADPIRNAASEPLVAG